MNNEQKNTTNPSIGKIISDYSAIIGLVCGIISAIFWLSYIFTWCRGSGPEPGETTAGAVFFDVFFSLLFGVVGIIFGNKAKRSGENSTLAKASLIVPLVSLILDSFLLLFFLCAGCGLGIAMMHVASQQKSF